MRILILFLVVCTLSSFGQTPAKKAVFIIVDGISSNSLERLNAPNLKAIAGKNGYQRAYVGGERGSYSQTPTISAVGYNSLLTGTWVNKHNVWDNRILSPNYHYWSIFRFFSEQYPHKKTAVFSTWLDNRTKLLGDNLEQTGKFQVGYHFDGFELDSLRYPFDPEADRIHQIDELVSINAATYIRESAPDLSWVYLQYTDDMGHKYGDGEKFDAAVLIMDKQVGRIWEAVQYRNKQFKEDWQIYITTDHGRDSKTGQNHGGQSDRERGTWIVTNAQNLNQQFTLATPSVVDIMPSIANHLNVNIPKDQLFEIDGISLTGKLSINQVAVKLDQQQTIAVQWNALSADGTVKVWLATSNLFETGGKDFYRLITEVPTNTQAATIDVSKLPKGFYKIVLEGKYNSVNKWVVSEVK